MKNVAKKNKQRQSASQQKRAGAKGCVCVPKGRNVGGNATTRRECISVLLLFLLQGIRIKDIIIFFIKVSNSDKNYKHTHTYRKPDMHWKLK